MVAGSLTSSTVLTAEFEDQETRSQKIQELKLTRFNLLREEARGRAIELVGKANEVRVELDLAVEEEEGRRAPELTSSLGSVLVARAVNVELFPLDLPFRMGQKHARYGEGTETKLGGVHHLARPADRTAPVTETELARDNEDVASLLLVAQRLERLHRFGVLSQVLRTGLVPAVVVELPRGLDGREHLFDGLTVGRAKLLPPRHGEPSFGVLGKRPLGDALVVRGILELWKELTQDRRLFRDVLNFVSIGVRVTGTDLLVRELVAHGELPDAGDDPILELVAVLNELLRAVFVEETLGDCAIHGVFHEPLDLLLLSVCDGRDRRCRHRHSTYSLCQ